MIRLLQVLSWLAGLAGFALLVVGVSQINVAAAFIVAGLGLMLWAYLADRAVASLSAQGRGG